ncbi:tRNA pseudouridine synthase A [Mucilaginibacter antarcticus]|uniref:tRNA pseudouridine synthase A n=1 Tax=Mucilaginibacter antarcticus TaxID=1855725 RepID=A0ABW5XUF7_9SPHI
MRYFVHIGYHGTKYSGWQRDPDVINVQQVIETALTRILKTPTFINGCGRTDAHVHASQFFFHMDVEREWDFDLVFRLNKLLPADIAVFDIIPMDGLPHARFDAVSRSYDYFIHTYKDPFLSDFSSLYLEKNWELDKMKAAVALLPLYNDYRCFCKTPDKNSHNICNVTTAALFVDAQRDRLRFQISANRFLGKMIRIIMGRLLEIGRGKMSVDEFESYLISKQTPAVIIPAHPQGLYLSKVTYPYLNLTSRSAFALLRDEESWLTV